MREGRLTEHCRGFCRLPREENISAALLIFTSCWQVSPRRYAFDVPFHDAMSAPRQVDDTADRDAFIWLDT